MQHEDLPLVDAAALTDLARAAYGPEGRLATPPELATSGIFPYEGELLVRALDDPVLPEPARHGETATDCNACATTDDVYVWVTERWRLRAPAQPQPVPAFLLEPRRHLDLGDLDETLAAEMGVLTWRIERALVAIPGVGRVHVNRWGDGAAHLHLWFFARPEGMLQLRGSCLPDWLDVLPPLPTDVWDSVAARVVEGLSQSS